ncbi:glycosyltransferase family 4 protein [Pseudomonadales bacterium]|nr:glycosyltransferase family 4 protein [Pseudomonadales bacterium]MDB9916840.1 glycosyltransferase family 4 protein [Pseudomonadales bacterium]
MQNSVSAPSGISEPAASRRAEIKPTPKLKICLLGYRSNPYSGGQGIYIRYLSKALVRQGHQVDVISGEPYPILDPGVNLIKLPGLNLFEADNHVTALRPRHLLSYTDFFEWFSMLTGGFPEPYTFGRRLVKHFRRHKPDYDIVHDNQSLCFGLLKLQHTGTPLIATIHHPITSDLAIALGNTDDWKLRLLIRRWHSFLGMQKKVVRRLKHIVTVSEQSKADIASAFDINAATIKVVHNGIDTEIFRPQPETPRTPFRIMATASADQPLKGLSYLIEAIALLTPDYPQIHLVVLGKINADGESQQLINRLGIQAQIRFVSGVSTDELVTLYAETSLVVVPSIYEGFGLPAGEAMACGVAVISTKGGALPEVVGDGGILVPVRDPEAIASAVADLLDHPEKAKALGLKARSRILDKFSWQVAAASMTQTYQHIIDNA